MASALSESLHNLNGIEELEITEEDEALLRNLLEESINDENEKSREDGVTYAVHSLELEVSNDSYAKIDEIQGHLLNLDWPDTMDIAEPAALPPDEATVWYVDDMDGMVDFTCNGDCSEFYRGVFSDETTYCRLWEE